MLHHLVVMLTLVSGLRFVYLLNYIKLPKQFFLFLAAAIVVGIWTLYSHNPLHLFSLVILAEIVRVILSGILKMKKGAWSGASTCAGGTAMWSNSAT